MSDEASPLQILFSDKFKDRLRSLAKRYRQIKDSTCVLLVTIYSKSDQNTIAADKIRDIIAAFEAPDL